MRPEIKYDKDSKVVSIRVGRKRSVDSDVKGNVVVDYDADGEMVNIDIMEISLAEFSKIKKLMPSKELARA
ncbi:DUF2283 domain-containing protein [Patescibacteria group bacterium]|nr:DUF2283 domain-containing protein [Patescibacteria group bacterium]MBU4511837.1 DUF2283 domain-containing protein [Patescibacteria group bacterium]MCG2693432.1 DUF2283 domain-containing protein [Candidatus Parcubacteria bacterium]